MLKTKKVVENKVETDDKVRTLDEEGRKEGSEGGGREEQIETSRLCRME